MVRRYLGTGYGYTLALFLEENFVSLNRSNGVSKNLFFYTDFKNVHLFKVKISPIKRCAQKNDFLGLFLLIYHFKQSNSL